MVENGKGDMSQMQRQSVLTPLENAYNAFGSKRQLPASLSASLSCAQPSPLKREVKEDHYMSESFKNMNLAETNTNLAETQAKSKDVDKREVENAISSELAQKRPDVRKAQDSDFKRLIVLGHGTFAQVCLVQCDMGCDKGQLFAMKILQKKLIIAKNQTAHTMTERSILGRCSSNHPFIVSLRYAFQTAETLNLVIDFCSGGELYYHLSRLGRFPVQRARFYAAELSLALEHLHSYDVVYRDLKPENVLISSDGHIMLADFGLSKENIAEPAKGTDTFCGTPEYLAPEILKRCSHGKAVDWWSLGVLLYEMLYGLPPWYSKNRRTMFDGICNKPLVFPQQNTATPAGAADALVPDSAKLLITGLLMKNPHERLGSMGPFEVHSDPFFAGINFHDLLAKKLEAPWKPDKGKIYFDQEYTKLPISHPVAPSMQAQAPDYSQASCNVQTTFPHADAALFSTSPLLPSSFADKAFTGFSYTNPVAAAANMCTGSPGLPGKNCMYPGSFRDRHPAPLGSLVEAREPASTRSSGDATDAADMVEDGLPSGGTQGTGPKASMNHPSPRSQHHPNDPNRHHAHGAHHYDDDEGQFNLELEEL